MAKLSATFSAPLSLTALLLAAATPALADGPSYEKPRGYQERYSGCQPGSFAGTYIGAAAGFSWSNMDNEVATSPDSHSGTVHNAFTAGLLAGRNWQCNGFVYGVEGDVNFNGPKTTIIYKDAQLSSAGSWYSTLRGRVGISDDDFMVFLTGGLAFGGMDHEFDAPKFGVQSSSSTFGIGYTLGAGAELNRGMWGVRLEALYVDLGTSTHSYAVPSFASTQWADSFWVGRLGVTVKIGDRD